VYCTHDANRVLPLRFAIGCWSQSNLSHRLMRFLSHSERFTNHLSHQSPDTNQKY
jgi:hypothetical protein